jgi:hypothetical protein
MGGVHNGEHWSFPPQPSLRQRRLVWAFGTGMWLYVFFRARAELPHLLGFHKELIEEADEHKQSKNVQKEGDAVEPAA